jgi:hypothetical protein
MAINFPDGPSTGQEFTDPITGLVFIWNGYGWAMKPEPDPPPPIDAYTKTESEVRFVNVPGDVMTGFLFLHAHPQHPFHASTKQYVDDAVGGVTNPPVDLTGYVKKTGDVMSGDLTLPVLHGSGANVSGVANVGTLNAVNAIISGQLDASIQPIFMDRGFYSADRLSFLRLNYFNGDIYVNVNEAQWTLLWTDLKSTVSGANPGYMKLPNTIIVQWGQIGGGGADMWVNFPVTFAAALLGLTYVVDSGGTPPAAGETFVCSASYASASSFLAHPRVVSAGGAVAVSPYPIRWMAVGW